MLHLSPPDWDKYGGDGGAGYVDGDSPNRQIFQQTMQWRRQSMMALQKAVIDRWRSITFFAKKIYGILFNFKIIFFLIEC